MATAGERTLQLLTLLQRRHHWSGADLAARLEISERTLRRDVDRLRALGYPVEAQRGVDGGYQMVAGASMPPLTLTDDEAIAIVVGLRAATVSTVAGVSESSLGALAKVIGVLPANLRRQAESLAAMTTTTAWYGPASTVDAAVLTTIAQAARNGETLCFVYTANDETTTSREVEPHSLVVLGHRWYLVAYDTNRYDWRTFRVDRITEPSNTGRRFTPKELPADDASTFLRTSIQSMPTANFAVDITLRAPAERVTPHAGRWGRVERVSDDECRLRMTVDTLQWPAMLLGVLDVDFEIHEPPELRDYLRRWAARFRK